MRQGFHPFWRWGLPIAALLSVFWLSLFCYSAIPIPALSAVKALITGSPSSLPEALVLNLRLPRSLVAVLIGASLALSGALLQTLTHNPLASPSLLGINSGAALAMALTSAFSSSLSGYPIAFVAAIGGGLCWLMVMAAGGGGRQTLDRNRLILAGVALSALCMALTRITLLLAEDHAEVIQPRAVFGQLATTDGGTGLAVTALLGVGQVHGTVLVELRRQHHIQQAALALGPHLGHAADR